MIPLQSRAQPTLLRFVVLAAVMGFATFAALEWADAAPAQHSPPIVRARLVLSTSAVHAGMRTHAAAVVTIAPNFHINDHHPALDYLIPTELKLHSGKTFSVGRVTYPSGRLEKLAFSSKRLSVYKGRLVVMALLRVGSGTAPGEYPLRGKLEYQACNDHACFPPAVIPLKLNVQVMGSSIPLHAVHPAIFRKARTR